MLYNVDPNKALIYTHPEIAKEWHKVLNGKLTPYDVSIKSGRNVYWECEHGHVWQSKIISRTQAKHGKTQCPHCKTLAFKFPEVAKEWHSTLNGSLTPNKVTAKSAKVAHWQCQYGHVWKCKVWVRTYYNTGCPYCANRAFDKSNSLGVLNPNLAKELHKELNKNINLFNIPVYSQKKLHWQCLKNKDHIWLASPYDRHRRKTGCPYCAKVKIHYTEKLASVAIDLVNEWHPTKNGKRTPYNMSASSTYRAQWKCRTNPEHEWIERIYLRVAGKGCPICRH